MNFKLIANIAVGILLAEILKWGFVLGTARLAIRELNERAGDTLPALPKLTTPQPAPARIQLPDTTITNEAPRPPPVTRCTINGVPTFDDTGRLCTN